MVQTRSKSIALSQKEPMVNNLTNNEDSFESDNRDDEDYTSKIATTPNSSPPKKMASTVNITKADSSSSLLSFTIDVDPSDCALSHSPISSDISVSGDGGPSLEREPLICAKCTEEMACDYFDLVYVEGRCSYCGKRFYSSPHLIQAYFSPNPNIYVLEKITFNRE